MKKFLIMGAAISVLTTAPAVAADLGRPAPVYRPPPPVVRVWSWTGCYIGGHIGGLWATRTGPTRRQAHSRLVNPSAVMTSTAGWAACRPAVIISSPAAS